MGKITREVADQGVGPRPTTISPATARFNSVDGKSELERYQYPITLAWAVSIHKVQGVSLDRAVIDLENAVFDHGQAHVALSRVRSFEGVLLVDLSKKAFTWNDKAVDEEYARLANHRITI